MKKIRKTLCTVLALFLLIGSIPFMGIAASAAGELQMTASNVEGQAGSTVEIPVTITANPGFSAFAVSLDYDTTSMTFTSASLVDGVDGMLSKSATGVTWFKALNYDGTGPFMKLCFTIATDAEVGSSLPISFSYNTGDICNDDEDDVAFSFSGATVTVLEGTPVTPDPDPNPGTDPQPGGDPTLTLGNAEGDPGDVVSIPIEISNNPGFSAISAGVSYDSSALTLVSAPLASGVGGQISASSSGISWLNGTDFNGNGAFFTLRFKINSVVTAGDYPVALTVSSASNYDEDDVDFTVANGAIKVLRDGVAEPDPGPGTDPGQGTDPQPTGDPTITIASVSGERGETVTLPVTITNNPGFSAMIVKLNYNPDDLTFVSTTLTQGLPGQFSATANGWSWVTSPDFTADGVYATITFTVNDNATFGDHPVSISARLGDISNYDEDDVIFTMVDGNVNVPDTSAVTPTMTVGSVSGALGETVTLPVSIADNPGFNTFVLDVNYDKDNLTFTGAALVQGISGQLSSSNKDKISWINGSDYTGNGNFMTISFVINSDASEGTTFPVSLSYTSGNLSNYDESDVDIDMVAGSVTVLQHVHAYGSVVTEPTCTANGYTTYTCSICGDTFVDDTVPALGHSYVDVVTEPTCEEAGYTTHTCSRCGNIIVDTPVQASGHNFNEVVVEPTCTENGSITKVCSKCGYSFISETLNATGHNYVEEVVAATCTEAGYTKHTCSKCGATFNDTPVTATGHHYSATGTVEATCTEGGYTVYTCSGCGDSYEADFTDARGHSWDDGVITARPTETTTGIKLYTCSVCGETKEEVIPVLDYLRGDINGDGRVNTKDLTRLLKYISDDSTPVVLKACDVNGDGEINSKDLTRLMKYISGQNVEIF